MTTLFRKCRRGDAKRSSITRALAVGVVLLGWAVHVSAVPGDRTALVLVSKTAPDSVPEALKPFYGGRYRRADGKLLDLIHVPGRPPEPGRGPVAPATFSRASTTISGVPAFVWTYGCSPTVAGMLCGLLDRGNYANLYTGSVNGGVCPLSNAAWGGTGTGEGAEGECSFVASHLGVDGRATNGHVDDYWFEYESIVDPYFGNWAPHNLPGEGDCLADFMGTSQYNPADLEQADGFTSLFYDPDNGPHVATEFGDGAYGVKLFMESRGYQVDSYFNQYIAVPGGPRAAGFTFAQFKTEIDAGRPVFLHVTGHSMLGIGYDDVTEKIYLHDTWDYETHEMTWGGDYDGMSHYAVSVFRMKPGDAPPGDFYSGGSGTAGAPYLIANKADLLALRNSPGDYHRHFRVTADIDLTGETFSDALLAPDTDSSNDVFDGVKFSGTIDGGGYVIQNLTIATTRAGGDYLGLFGFLEGGGREVVTNLGVEGAVTASAGSRYVGGFCGYNWYGTVSGCHAAMTVTSGGNSESVGGFCGYNYGGRISDSYATGAVSFGGTSSGAGGLCGTNMIGALIRSYATGTVTGGASATYVGGFCGENTSDYSGYPGSVVQDCYATGAVTAGEGSASVGGFCGDSYESLISRCYGEGRVIAGVTSQETGGFCGSEFLGQINGCYATGNVTGDRMVGGLCGSSDGVTGSYATGTVGGYLYVGGLCGFSDGIMLNCYATGAVFAEGIGVFFGGLCGDKSGGEITNCYATGTVTGVDGCGYLGGLCGRNDNAATIRWSYATGVVSAGIWSYYLGGLCGLNGSGTAGALPSTIHDCYAWGNVIGGADSSEIGGFCGQNDPLASIRNCYSTGQVDGGSLLGGLCGVNEGVITASFWDTTTSRIGTSAGGSGAVGKLTAQLQVMTPFTGAGWDFSVVDGAWKMPRGVPGYPMLSWQVEMCMLILTKGWNLVSLPIEPVEPAAEKVLGGEGREAGEGRAGPAAYVWNGAGGVYTLVTEMHACIGYWVYATEAEAIGVLGTRVTQESLALGLGWTLCGVNAEYPIPVDARIQGIYYWNTSTLRYEVATGTLRPGVGYWFVTDAAADIPLGEVVR